MSYFGEVHNGVVVFKDAPPLKEGTRVRIVPEPTETSPKRGSGEAVLRALSRVGNGWAESAAEMDDALEYIRKTKWDDVRRQQTEPEPRL